MKKIIFILLTAGLIMSCKKEKSPIDLVILTPTEVRSYGYIDYHVGEVNAVLTVKDDTGRLIYSKPMSKTKELKEQVSFKINREESKELTISLKLDIQVTDIIYKFESVNKHTVFNLIPNTDGYKISI